MTSPEEKEGKERHLIKLRDTGDDNEMVAIRKEENKEDAEDEKKKRQNGKGA